MRRGRAVRALILLSLALPAAAAAQAEPRDAPAEEPRDTEPGPAEDDAEAEARALFARGRDLAHDRRFNEAAALFTRSVALVDRPSSRFNLALCHYALERYVEAIAHLERYLAIADRAQEGLSWDDALRMITHARRSVAALALEVTPADARVTVDGAPVDGGAHRAVSLNPGAHVVRVDAPGHAPSLVTVRPGAGERLLRVVHLEPTQRRPRLTVRARDAAPIRVDGEAVGHGEASLELAPGPHVLTVGALRREVVLEDGQHAWLELPGGAGADADAILGWSLAGGAAAVVIAVIVTALVATDLAATPEDTIVIREPAPTLVP